MGRAKRNGNIELPYGLDELDYFNFGTELAKNLSQPGLIDLEEVDDIKVQLYRTEYPTVEMYLTQLNKAAEYFIPKTDKQPLFPDSHIMQSRTINILQSCQQDSSKKDIARLKLEIKICEQHLEHQRFNKIPVTKIDHIKQFTHCSVLSSRISELHLSLIEHYKQEPSDIKSQAKSGMAQKAVSLLSKLRSTLIPKMQKDLEEPILKEIKNLKLKMLAQDNLVGMIKIQQVLSKKYAILAEYYHKTMLALDDVNQMANETIQKYRAASKEAEDYSVSVAALIQTSQNKENNKENKNALHIATTDELFAKILEFGDVLDNSKKLNQSLAQLLMYVNQFYESNERNIENIQIRIDNAAKDLNDVELSALKDVLCDQHIVNLIKAGLWSATNSQSSELAVDDLGFSKNTMEAAYMGAAYMLSTVHDAINNELYARALAYEEKAGNISPLRPSQEYQQIDFMNFDNVPNQSHYAKILEPYALKIGLDIDEKEKSTPAPVPRPH